VNQTNKPISIALNGQALQLSPELANPSFHSTKAFLDLSESITFSIQSSSGVNLSDQHAILFNNVDKIGTSLPWIQGPVRMTGNQLELEFTPYQVQFDIYNDATYSLGKWTMPASDVARDYRISAWVVLAGPFGNSSYHELLSGSRVRWQVFEYAIERVRSSLLYDDDSINTTHLASTTAGTQYRFQATLEQLIFERPDTGALVDTGTNTPAFTGRTEPITVVQTEPVSLTVEQSKSSLVSDGADSVDFEIFAEDQFGNPVSGATVGWFLETSPNAWFEHQDRQTRSNGRAFATLRTGVLKQDVNLDTSADSITRSVHIPVNGITGSISANTSVVDAYLNQSIELTVDANATDGAPVFWHSSSGFIQERSIVNQGLATAILTADPKHIGIVYVMVAVGDRVFFWRGQTTSSALLYFKVDHPTLVPANTDPLGNPYFGPDGSPIDLPLINTTAVHIEGPPNGLVTLSFPRGLAHAHVIGVNPINQLQFNVRLNGQGTGTIQLQANPIISSVEFPGGIHQTFEQGLINIRAELQQITGSPFIFAETDVKVVDPGSLAHFKDHVFDGVRGFVGGDTETATGAVFAVGRGMVLVADAGAIIKNAARYGGLSKLAPNDLEFAISIFGILSTVFPPADPFVSGLRVLAQRLGSAKSKLLGVLEDRFLGVLRNMPAGVSPWQSMERSLIKGEVDFVLRLKNDEVLSRICGKVCTSNDLWEATAKAFDDFGEPFVDVLKRLESNSVRSAQFVDVMGGLKPSAVAALRSKGALADVLDSAVELLSGRVRPENLKKLLNNEIAFSGGYNQADFLLDAMTIVRGNPNVGGFQGLVEELSRSQDISGANGFIFEMQIGVHLTKLGERIVEISTTGSGRPGIDMVSERLIYTAKKSFTALAGPPSRSEIQRINKVKSILGKGLDTALKEGKPFSLAIQTGETLPQTLLDWMASKNPPIQVLYVPFRN